MIGHRQFDDAWRNESNCRVVADFETGGCDDLPLPQEAGRIGTGTENVSILRPALSEVISGGPGRIRTIDLYFIRVAL